MGQTISGLEIEISKNFVVIIEKLDKSHNIAKNMAVEYYEFFKVDKLNSSQMSSLLELVDKGSYESFVFDETYIECRYLINRVTKLLKKYEKLKTKLII